MAIERIVKPYEILFRLTPTGTVQGCHVRDLEIVTDTTTGEVFASKELDPKPVSGAYLTAILGTINTSLVKTLTERDIALADKDTLLAEKEEELAAKEEELVQVKEVLGITVAQVQEAEVLIQELQAAPVDTALEGET
jgi:hypothetical protein